jgi:ubiquinone/menaquinone biosynthesis C-methylase UbiE
MAAQTQKVHHPIFARLFARMSEGAEASGQAEHRRELLECLSGRVVEVGAGNGLNFRHYPETVSELVAVEPESYLRKLAVRETENVPIAVRVEDGVADRLPFEEASFDAGVVSLVLCSVPDQGRALSELYRVIRPGGELRFYEHVRGERPGFVRFQRAADAFWPLVGGGCHTSRETGKAIEQAGFTLERCRRFPFRPCFLLYPVTPHILGVARRP